MNEVLESVLMQGYYALFRGAYESGATFCVVGTKSFAKYPLPEYAEMKCLVMPDDTMALSYSFGLALSGKRTLCFVSSIPFDLVSEYSYTGVNGALVMVYLEDSDNLEYDSRPFFKACNYPIFEPSTPDELKRFVKISYNFSEKYDVPVIVRVSRELLNAYSEVPAVARKDIKDKPYKKDASKYVLLPSTIKLCAEDIVERNRRLRVDSESFPVNTVTYNDKKIGVVACGTIAKSVAEAMPEVSVLALGISNPLPMQKIKEFAQNVGNLYVVEEHPFIELALIKEGIECKGAELFPREGRRTVKEIACWIAGKTAPQVETKYGLRTPDFCNDCGLVPIVFSLKNKGIPVFTDSDCGILAGCFMSTNEVGIKHALPSALAFGNYQHCVCVLTYKEFLQNLSIVAQFDLSNISIVVAVEDDNYEKFNPIVCGTSQKIAVGDFAKLSQLEKKVYFVKVDRVCKYES